MILIRGNEEIHDAAVNLALEEYCVRNFDTIHNDYLLFYINSPSIIIGKHQNTIEEVNLHYVQEKNITVVRRISGGGAVYHDKGNLNFSFITKHTNDSINNFRKFTEPVTKALRHMGIEAELSGRNDITIEGKKISGNAQFTNTKSMFSHGTLLFDSHIEDVVGALNVKAEKIESKGIKSVRSRVSNIKPYLKNEMTIHQFKQEIIDSIFQGNVNEYILSSDEWKKVYELVENKYRTWEWNWGRSPDFNVQKVNRFAFGQVDARIYVKEGKIENIKFFGDFFGYGDTLEIEEKLTGIRYERQHLIEAIGDMDLSVYFGEINAGEFVNFLYE